MFNSDAKQDVFVANILKFKTNGTYVDIGSCGSINSNNSYYFDNVLNWKGICVEIEPSYKDSYNTRKECLFINSDATNLDYKKLFDDYFDNKSIDYLSLDIDTKSLLVLQILPFKEYKFKVITIEHDYYLYGDTYKKEQKNILLNNGYEILCENVYVEQPGYYGKNFPFEDWYVYPDFFEKNLITKIKCESIYPSEIINKFK